MGEELQGKESQKRRGFPGTEGPIGKEQIEKIYKEYDECYKGKQATNQRIKEAETWYRRRQWDMNKTEEDEPASAYLFNALINKHADAMDNYPSANILPREESDTNTAQQLSKIVPAILERSGYEKVYSDCYWSKLKTGTSVTGVFWNKHIDNGLGDVEVREIDMLNMYWTPGIKNIQESKYLFITDLVSNDSLMATYPFLEGAGIDLHPEARHESDDYVDNSDKTTVIDCYYKKRVGTREVVHYLKFIPGQLLYASENDERYMDRGFYDHGKFPVVFDVMWPEKESPAGFGYIDIMKEPQRYIDKMDGIILRHAKRTGKPRILVSDAVGMNIEEFNSDSDIVHVAGSLDDLYYREIAINPLDAAVYNRLQGKIEELKETSGNTDYSQGNSNGGVTAASAIAALQEASSKLSRDMIRQTYTAFTEIVLLVIENIRQFYDEPRAFRVLGNQNGEYDFVQFSNEQMQPVTEGMGIDFAERKPVYDIKVSSQKASPYSKVAQNELAKELYGLGVFNPEMADQMLMMLEMMDFDGKDVIERKVRQNASLFRENQMLKEQMMKMAAIIDVQNGSSISGDMMASFQQQQGNERNQRTIQAREEKPEDLVSRAKQRTAERTNPT